MKKQKPQTLHFTLRDEYIELNNLLKVMGLAHSGAAGKLLVATGEVRVDDVIEQRKTAKIRTGQCVKLADISIRVHAADAVNPSSE